MELVAADEPRCCASVCSLIPALLDNLSSPRKHAIAILEPLGFHSVTTDLEHFVIGHPYLPLSAVLGRVAIWSGLATIAAAAVVAVPTIRWGHEEFTRLLPALPPLLAAPAGMIVYSSVTTSIWDTRNLITAWPGLAGTARTYPGPAPLTVLEFTAGRG